MPLEREVIGEEEDVNRRRCNALRSSKSSTSSVDEASLASSASSSAGGGRVPDWKDADGSSLLLPPPPPPPPDDRSYAQGKEDTIRGFSPTLSVYITDLAKITRVGEILRESIHFFRWASWQKMLTATPFSLPIPAKTPLRKSHQRSVSQTGLVTASGRPPPCISQRIYPC